MNWEIRQGHVLDRLREMPAALVHCVVTSPPYWGLRAYGTEPQVWGGDPDCSHEYEAAPPPGVGQRGNKTGELSTSSLTNPQRQDAVPRRALHSAICTLCGAWWGELGSEPAIALYIDHLVQVFREVRRVLRPDGTLWLNIGDACAGSGKGPSNSLNKANQHSHDAAVANGLASRRNTAQLSNGQAPIKAKNLCLIPERLAIALQDDGWWVRSRIAWCKTSVMPESVQDRPTTAWEYIWLLSKSARYYYDGEAVKQSTEFSNTHGWGPVPTHPNKTTEPGTGVKNNQSFLEATWAPVTRANMRNFWVLGPEPFPGAHFAVFPTEIPKRAILAGTSAYGACAACGAPWRRIVKKERVGKNGQRLPSGWDAGPGAHSVARNDERRATEKDAARLDDGSRPRRARGHSAGWRDEGMVHVATLGWEPTCKCPRTDVEPCVVFDPFVGSGTTLAVAKELGRNAIGLELQPEYVDLAERRIGAANAALPGLVV